MGKGTTQFLFVGNHPCLDFVNTQMIVKGEPIDALESFDDLVSWLIRAKLMTTSLVNVTRAEFNQNEATSLLEQAKHLRATMRDLAERIATRKPISDTSLQIINQFLSQRPGYPQLVRKKGGFVQHFHSAASPAQRILAPLIEAVSDVLCRTDWTLIKKCGNPACILYFYDTTKNHARNWCSMQMCGNRMKVAAHYWRNRSRQV